jgi:hypothetical protein
LLLNGHRPLDSCSLFVFCFEVKRSKGKVDPIKDSGAPMAQVKIAGTVFSVIAIFCFVLALSWVGLALLGF